MSVVFEDSDLDSFQNFMSNKSMFQFAITLVIVSHLKNITTNISETILTPIIDKITNSKISRLSVNLFGIDFFLGKVVSNLISFLFMMVLLYAFIKTSRIDKKLKKEQAPSPVKVQVASESNKNASSPSSKETTSSIKLNI